MPVYVDDMRAPYGRMVMCHMIADTTDELLAMADTIGVDRRWIQHAGTNLEHFDVSLTKRGAAIRAGAVAVSIRALALKLRAKREAGGGSREASRPGE